METTELQKSIYVLLMVTLIVEVTRCHGSTQIAKSDTTIACGKDGVCDCNTKLFGQYEVDCHNCGLSSIPQEIPTNTTLLNLGQNDLSTLPHNAFEGLRSLTILLILNNNITTLPNTVFKDLSSLDSLYIGYNKLSTLPTSVFENLKSLTILDLSHNDLSTLPVGIFRKLISLTIIYLNHNKLSVLPDNVFEGLTSLDSLFMSMNQLSTLPDNVFDDLKSITCIEIAHNHLSVLPNNTFEGLTKLLKIDLKKNELSTLPNGVFEGLISLLELILADNHLSELQSDIFKDLQSVSNIDLGNNELRTLPNQVFENLTLLVDIELGRNKISVLPKVFGGLQSLRTIDLSYNEFTRVPNDIFEDLNSIRTISFKFNRLNELEQDVFKGTGTMINLYFETNELRILPPKVFSGLSQLQLLYLYNNSIIMLKNDTFWGLPRLELLILSQNRIQDIEIGSFRGLTDLIFLDLSDNNIDQIVPGLFTQSSWNKLTTLFLQKNNLTIIHRNTFSGLNALRFLCIYSNKIHKIEDRAFSHMTLQYLYLFQNDLTNITGNPFGTNNLWQLHLYGNNISFINPQSLKDIPTETILYLSCEFLHVLPRNPSHGNINCISSSSLPTIKIEGDYQVVMELGRDGFNCTGYKFTCTPCEVGTYGNTLNGGCVPCPIGGFYQDDVAQTIVPHQSKWNIPCKVCPVGTYVQEGKGIAAKECKVCPEGTNQTVDAGYRACYCKKGFARTDRYGPCYSCLQEGLNCSQGYQTLLPGYMWNWSFPDANLTEYKAFAENLETKVVIKQLKTSVYTGGIPRVFKCPDCSNCPNNNDSIGGNCAVGYTGWLCTRCETGFYSVLTSCVPCPSLAVLLVESCAFFTVCALVFFLLSRKVKQKAENEVHVRSFADVIIARIKLLLGFYQVIGEVITSLHDINWTGPLVVMSRFISALEMNILKLFVRPRCFDVKLELSPRLQFLIGAITPIIILLIPLVFYQTRVLYVRLRFPPSVYMSLRSHFKRLRAALFAFVVVLWFIIYPPVCSVIFSLYPISCKIFSLDQNNTYNITRLRSDFDTDCTGLRAYHVSAIILTIVYVIAFPVALLYVLRKSYPRFSHCHSSLDDQFLDNHDSSNDSVDPTAPMVIDNSQKPSPPTWLTFFCENYKKKFYFWEIIELARKVTQTLLITLFGWEDRLTVILTTCISVLFLLLHACYRPMKSSYEQSLQMLSLTVIFINVIVAANDIPDKHQDSISTILVLLNILMVVIIAGEVIVTVIIHVRHLGITTMVVAFVNQVRGSGRTSIH